MSIIICSSLRAAARRWRRVGPLGVASIGCRHQLADQPHRREATDIPVRASQRSQILVKNDPVLDRRARSRVDIDMDMDMNLDRAVRQWEKQEPTPTTASPAPSTPTKTMVVAAKSTETERKVSAAGLKRLMKDYGPVAVSFHASVFLTTLGCFFSLVDYGLDVASLVENVPVIANNLPHKSAGNLALAWALTTVTGPVRGLMTVTLTPRVAKLWWGREAKRRLKGLAKDKTKEASSE